MQLPKLERVEDLRSFIKESFDVELPVEGGWGESEEDPTLIPSSNPQMQLIFATIKANLLLNILQPKEQKFGGINLKEKERTKEGDLEIVTYVVQAIKEDEYAKLIDEYKAGYEREDFDLEAHFERRKRATKNFELTSYFLIRPSEKLGNERKL